AVEGAAGEGLGDEPAPVDDLSRHTPRKKSADQGPAVPPVSEGEGAGEVAGVEYTRMRHATAPPAGGAWSSMPAMGGRSSTSRTSERSFQPARIADSWAW